MKVHAIVRLGQSQNSDKRYNMLCEKCLTGDICNTWRAERNTPSVQPGVQVIETNLVSTDKVPADNPRNLVTQFAVGHYVATVYDSRWYVGKIVDIDDEESHIEITFMARRKQFYQWPTQQDKIWVKANDILCGLSIPVSTGKSSRMFKLNDNDEQHILASFEAYKQ